MDGPFQKSRAFIMHRSSFLGVALLFAAAHPLVAMAQSSAAPTEQDADAARQRERRLPAYRTDLTLQDFRAHDPFIVAHEAEKAYYLYSGRPVDESGRSGVVAYKSRDLKTWEGPQVVFRVPDGIWANPTHGTWAPEVHEYRGKYYLFVTLHNRDAMLAEPPQVWHANHLRGTAVARADGPGGPFELLKTDGPHPPREFMTLDGTLYVDPAASHGWSIATNGSR